jgi:hypothetical protein
MFQNTSLLISGVLASSALALLAAPAPASAKVLYTLTTTCSLMGADPQACTVEAEDFGSVTLYRHRIGAITKTIRITDTPLKMELYDADTKQWNQLQSASARFSANTVCFNGRDLCVVNPNYLNSVKESRPELMAGRDLVRVHFDSNGRTNASCYDDGCDLVLK